MKLYIGGAYQGQETLARRENPSAEIIEDFHLLLKNHAGDPHAFAEIFIREHPNAVVVANEIGCGVVPIDPEERTWRERAGRALCDIAAYSETVVRVSCGIGVRIK